MQQKQTEIRTISSFSVMQDLIVVAVAQKDSCNVFMVKLKSSKSEKARIKKPECTIFLDGSASKTMSEIFGVKIIKDTQIEFLVGNTYQLQKRLVNLVEDKDGSASFKKKIVISETV